MLHIFRGLSALCFLVVLHGAVPGVCEALGVGKVAEVSVSPDVRRVSIKIDGIAGNHAESTAANPSRLIIDIPGAGVGKPLVVKGAGKESGLSIRVAKSESGARVVLDFGTASIPEYRVRRLGSFLMVFLQEWHPTIPKPQRAAVQEQPAEKELPPLSTHRIRRDDSEAMPSLRVPREREQQISRVRNGRAGQTEVRQAALAAAGPHHESAELFIRSAEVSGGLIVLHVARRSDPATLYRIDLGLDFTQLGFSAARISPVGSSSAAPIQVAARKSPFWDDTPPMPRIGPRKYQGVVAQVESREPAHGPLRVSRR